MMSEEIKAGLSEKARAIVEQYESDLRKDYEKMLQHPYIQEMIKSGEWEKMSHWARKNLLLDLYPCPAFFSENSRKMYEEGKLKADIARAEWAKEQKRRNRGR